MCSVVISDTSCLIALERINRLGLLQDLFQQILTTPEVQNEFGNELPKWIEVSEVRRKIKIQELEAVLDKGEASAIALALETEESLLIIDEKKGREVARSLNIEIIGTLRIIQMAKQKGLILSVWPLIEDLQKAGFRISQKVLDLFFNI